ncbi:hypothetical protein BJV74DRAFT_849407 [Russula compacta]|nr:hypothetical protein BJV74DRAFT_849407 [Russula compacta]
METFSWSDSLRALTSQCLACLRPPKNERSDLEDLLADSGSGTLSTPAATTTADAETLSLHSNPGGAPPRRKRARFGKAIRLFGWDLFGRRPPIRLPDDNEEEEEEEQEQGEQAGKKGRGHHHYPHRRRRPPPPAISTSTLDSDAAPLDSAAIVSHATKHAEEEAARAARRARRRERKEMKRAALALALEHAAILDDDAEFEGFPGSGSRRAAAAAGEQPPPHFVRDGASAGVARELRGIADHNDDDDDDDEEEEEEGDFDASSYARRASGSSDSGRGSDSRSRTSTSLSLSLSGQQQQTAAHSVQPYNHHYISQQPTAHHPSVLPPPPVRRANAKNHKSSRSSSSPSASQSPSLASPVAPQFSDAAAVPRTAQEFGGFPRGPSLHTGGIERLSSGFPSPGFGGPRNGKRDLGAFLANRGDA